MKKMFGVLLLFMAVFCFLAVKKEPLTAYAADPNSPNYLNVEVKCLTAADVAYYHNSTHLVSGGTKPLQVGDYALTYTIHNNTGFAATGTTIKCNPNLCTTVNYDNDTINPKVVYYKEEVLQDSALISVVTLNDDPKTPIFGFGTMGLSNAVGNGKIVTLFVRPTQSLSLEDEMKLVTDLIVREWDDELTVTQESEPNDGFTLYHQSDDPSEPNSRVVIIGDINGDGIITIEDTQILLDLYSNFFRNSTVDFSVAYVSNCVDANGNPISIDGYVLIIVGDVNEDGLINNADAELLMEYFADYVLAGNNLADYDGIIGTEATVYEVIKVTFPT